MTPYEFITTLILSETGNGLRNDGMNIVSRTIETLLLQPLSLRERVWWRRLEAHINKYISSQYGCRMSDKDHQKLIDDIKQLRDEA